MGGFNGDLMGINGDLMVIKWDWDLSGYMMYVPSGKLTQLWKITMFNGKTHYTWPCSIAMLNFVSVSCTKSRIFHQTWGEELRFEWI